MHGKIKESKKIAVSLRLPYVDVTAVYTVNLIIN